MESLVFWTMLIMCGRTPVSEQSGAERVLQERMRTPLLRVEGSLTGEGLCWHAAYNMSRFMVGYRTHRDPAYLDAAVQYYEALIAKMHTSPDGYKGWVGPFIYDEEYICDVHIGDAILLNPMLDFAESVLTGLDEPVRQKYGERANAYLDLARKHLIEKWDVRDTWREDGEYGGYVSWDHYLTPDNLQEWRKLPVEKSNLSLPFNKQNSMGIACLRIYRITGETAYRDKAVRIFNFMKSRMCLFEDHYVWNYWEPMGPWDMDAVSNQPRHWVNVHPYRNYQAGEIHEIVEAYHSGVTFTVEDIQHIINTNLQVMWNGDLENPQWRNSNAAVEKAALGRVHIVRPTDDFRELAGTLWSGLADFDATIRQLMDRPVDRPISFDRRHPRLPVTILASPFSSNRYFVMVAVMPSVARQGHESLVVSKSRVRGDIEVALYSDDGQQFLLDLRGEVPASKTHEGSEFLVLRWDASDISPGRYRVRWTLRGEYREFPVVVME